jgi:hypothetical protein
VQKLHLVGFTTDHRALILSVRRGARSGRYVLELDDKVTDSVTEAIARRAAALDDASGESIEPQAPPRPESALSVRELQARLRAGRSVEEVAAEAGVDAEWVERFAPPVVAEQARVVAATRAAYFERSRLGPSGVPLGLAVYRNLVERGLRLTAEELDAGWTARQGADGRWLVTLTYSSRGREHQPTWELEGPRGPVRADDRLAADLAYIAPESPPPVPKPVVPTKVVSAAPTDGDREAARRVAIARREAEARLDEAARAASRRNAELARRGMAEEPPAVPAPAPPVTPAKAGTPTRTTRGSAVSKPKGKAKPAAVKPSRAAPPKTTTTAAKGRKRAAPAPAAAKGKKRHAKATAGTTRSKDKGKAPAHARQPAKPTRRRAPVLRTDLAEPGRPNGAGAGAAAPTSSSRSRRPERLRSR